MRVKQGALYCAEHLTATSTESTVTEQQEDKRIPCPLDPAHSVYESKLKSHLKKCNARIPEIIPDYFCKDLNSNACCLDYADCEESVSCKSASISDLVERVEKVSKDLEEKVSIISTRYKLEQPQVINETEKHRLQQDALSQLILENVRNYEKVVVCEFGAGKGGLSSFLWESFFKGNEKIDSEFILIDRSNSRCKKDAKMKHEGAKVKRIFIDIKDLDLNNLFAEYDKERTYFLWISKHLCGTATCLTINALTNLKTQLKGTFCVALCCHQCCAWKAYPNKKFLIESGLIVEKNEVEREKVFKMLCSITSWAVCGFRDYNDSDDEEKGVGKRPKLENFILEPDQIYSDERKESVGRTMKRLLDYGRKLKLEDSLFNESSRCELKHYIEEDVTLENAVLVGSRQ